MFAPGVGVPEDPVTGTASGAVGAYLTRYGALEGEGQDGADATESATELRLEQGHYLDRPGTVRVRVDGEVSVGGRGVTVLDGRLMVPAAEDEDILEA